jgi:hypothetical protein
MPERWAAVPKMSGTITLQHRAKMSWLPTTKATPARSDSVPPEKAFERIRVDAIDFHRITEQFEVQIRVLRMGTQNEGD